MKLLVVEDEPKLADALSRGLDRQGYSTDVLDDGEKALTRISLHRNDYDLVILDLMLPSLSGDQVVKRARELNVNIPILILTARADTEVKVSLLLSGADDYLVKPFSFAELQARIQALLRRPAETLQEVLKLGDVELNLSTRKAYANGKEMPLTLKEFSLLEYLMRNPDKAVSREDLLSHAWDFNYDSFSNVVDVHVKNLRRKLEEAGGENPLETIRGIGYRIRS